MAPSQAMPTGGDGRMACTALTGRPGNCVQPFPPALYNSEIVAEGARGMFRALDQDGATLDAVANSNIGGADYAIALWSDGIKSKTPPEANQASPSSPFAYLIGGMARRLGRVGLRDFGLACADDSENRQSASVTT